MSIPIIDLFAGPGGLGEGFSALLNASGNRVFDIKLSIEKDEGAHQTLELRSFFRQFKVGRAPQEYYQFITGEISKQELFDRYPKQAKVARNEAWMCELGKEKAEAVDDRIDKALQGTDQWVLIGGPPCQAYSLAGRSRVGGIKDDDHRVYLYREYLRIIARHTPTVFVMENVKGLLSARVEGESVFGMIKNDLKNLSRLFPLYDSDQYDIYSFVTPLKRDEDGNLKDEDGRDFLIKCEDYGVPQKRHRVILLGIRRGVDTSTLSVLEKSDTVSLKSVIGDLPPLRSGLTKEIKSVRVEDGKKKRIYKKVEDTSENWVEIVRTYAKSLSLYKDFQKHIDVQDIVEIEKGRGANFIEFKYNGFKNPLKDWYRDPKLSGVPNHSTRGHLKSDLNRYLFAAVFSKSQKRIPKLKDFSEADSVLKLKDSLMPKHESATTGKFADRFRLQLADQPATTITSHISKDGHYFIHYDEKQCRSLTVREAARVQTFPDNYFFCGNRTSQYVQVGNAVPPFLALKIAETVEQVFRQSKQYTIT